MTLATLGSSSLGGCPASCPDTYRLTHDHRHVRNWARPEIGDLSQLRNIFFRLGTICLPRACVAALEPRASGVESEQALSLFNEAFGERPCCAADYARRVNGSMRCAAR